jgi:hypothetical protein
MRLLPFSIVVKFWFLDGMIHLVFHDQIFCWGWASVVFDVLEAILRVLASMVKGLQFLSNFCNLLHPLSLLEHLMFQLCTMSCFHDVFLP